MGGASRWGSIKCSVGSRGVEPRFPEGILPLQLSPHCILTAWCSTHCATSFGLLECLLQCPAHTTTTDLLIANQVKLAKRNPSWHPVSNLKAEILFRVSIRIGKWFIEKWRWSFRLQEQVPHRIVNPISALATSNRFGGKFQNKKGAVFRFVPEQIEANQLSLFNLGAKLHKRIVKYNFRF